MSSQNSVVVLFVRESTLGIRVFYPRGITRDSDAHGAIMHVHSDLRRETK